VVGRARELLEELERDRGVASPALGPGPASTSSQLGLFGGDEHPVLTRLRRIDADTLTPIQALTILAELASVARD
jgi:DNA mismatch repair protein MutS